MEGRDGQRQRDREKNGGARGKETKTGEEWRREGERDKGRRRRMEGEMEREKEIGRKMEAREGKRQRDREFDGGERGKETKGEGKEWKGKGEELRE